MSRTSAHIREQALHALLQGCRYRAAIKMMVQRMIESCACLRLVKTLNGNQLIAQIQRVEQADDLELIAIILCHFL